MPSRTAGRGWRAGQRYLEILGVLVRFGFGELVERGRSTGRSAGGREARADRSRAERTRRGLAALGPIFVKMGQILSTRPDLVPWRFVEELSKLQDEVPPVPFPEARRIVEAELARPLADVFERFDPDPLAAASIGQVHRARQAGAEVVVKVQRPGLREALDADLAVLLTLARLVESRFAGWEIHHPTRIIAEFARALEAELDYTVEAAWMERFAGCFAGDPTVRMPRVDRAHTTPRLLTMEYLPGVKISDLERLAREGLDRKEIARRLADLIVRQVFVHGFFHGDPHPGNLRVLPGNVICLLDFGTVGEISAHDRQDLADLLLALLRRDEAAAARLLARLATDGAEPELAALERDLRQLRVEPLGREFAVFGDLAFGALLPKILAIAATHRLALPPRFFLMLKSLSAVDGLGRLLNPEFNIMQHLAPLLVQLRRERRDSRRIAEEMIEVGADALLRLSELPTQVRKLLAGLESGRLTVCLERADRNRLLAATATNERLARAVVVGSLVVGSCVLAGLGAPPPFWHGVPLAAWAGWAFAALCAARRRR